MMPLEPNPVHFEWRRVSDNYPICLGQVEKTALGWRADRMRYPNRSFTDIQESLEFQTEAEALDWVNTTPWVPPAHGWMATPQGLGPILANLDRTTALVGIAACTIASFRRHNHLTLDWLDTHLAWLTLSNGQGQLRRQDDQWQVHMYSEETYDFRSIKTPSLDTAVETLLNHFWSESCEDLPQSAHGAVRQQLEHTKIVQKAMDFVAQRSSLMRQAMPALFL